jgi:methylmalonyl-CoA carboxyltransferase small subunit
LKLRIEIDGKTYDLDVEVLEEDRPQRRPGYLPPHAPPMTVRSAAGPAAPAAVEAPSDAEVDEEKVCRSPLAGVVSRVAVKAGQALAQDDLIMVLEAMKMETNITAAHPGTVKALRVTEGDAVKVGQVLMDYE